MSEPKTGEAWRSKLSGQVYQVLDIGGLGVQITDIPGRSCAAWWPLDEFHERFEREAQGE